MEIVVTGEPQVITRTITFKGTLDEWKNLQRECALLFRESKVPLLEGKLVFKLLSQIAEA